MSFSGVVAALQLSFYSLLLFIIFFAQIFLSKLTHLKRGFQSSGDENHSLQALLFINTNVLILSLLRPYLVF